MKNDTIIPNFIRLIVKLRSGDEHSFERELTKEKEASS